MQEGQRSPAMTITDGGPGHLSSPQCPMITGDPVAVRRSQVPSPGDVSGEDMTTLHTPTINADEHSPSDSAVSTGLCLPRSGALAPAGDRRDDDAHTHTRSLGVPGAVAGYRLQVSESHRTGVRKKHRLMRAGMRTIFSDSRRVPTFYRL